GRGEEFHKRVAADDDAGPEDAGRLFSLGDDGDGARFAGAGIADFECERFEAVLDGVEAQGVFKSRSGEGVFGRGYGRGDDGHRGVLLQRLPDSLVRVVSFGALLGGDALAGDEAVVDAVEVDAQVGQWLPIVAGIAEPVAV